MNIILDEKIINNNTRSLIGKDAGSSDNAYENAFLDQIKIYQDKAETEYMRAIYADIFNKKMLAKKHIDESLRLISEAFWRSEDTKFEEIQHERLHRIAKWKHDNIGCLLIKSGDDYVQRCSIAITHKRFGLSIGFTGDSICSICHKNEFECDHLKGRTYWVVGGIGDNGICKACDEDGCTLHDNRHLYKVCPSSRLKNSVLYEVSMVKKPAIPTARFTEIPVDLDKLKVEVGIIDESKGMVYSCHLCGGDCPGFTDFNTD